MRIDWLKGTFQFVVNIINVAGVLSWKYCEIMKNSAGLTFYDEPGQWR